MSLGSTRFDEDLLDGVPVSYPELLDFSEEYVAFDDVKGCALDVSKVRAARDVEMQFIKQRQVYK